MFLFTKHANALHYSVTENTLTGQLALLLLILAQLRNRYCFAPKKSLTMNEEAYVEAYSNNAILDCDVKKHF